MSRRFSRQFLLTSVCAAIISGAALMPQAAQAQAGAPELYFHPTKAWNIIERDEGCLAQNEFNNGFVLSFFGTTQWVNALDVNFRQNAFKQGDVYNVRVSVPGLASATVRAPAVSSDTVRIDLKSHKEFYKKMRASGVVDLVIEGNDFRFYLTGCANSAIQFERCMSGGKIQSAKDKPLVASAQKITTANTDDYMTNEAMALEAKAKAQTQAAIDEPRARLSEKLAQDIHDNPEMIAMDKDIPVTRAEAIAPPAPEEILELEKAAEPVVAIEAPEAMLPEPVVAGEPPVEELKAVVPDSMKEDVTWNDPPPMPQEVDAVKAVNIKTPEMKVTRKTGYAEADFRDTGYEKADVPIARTESNSALLDKIASMETKLGLMASENIALTQDLKQALRAAEKENLSIASDNWNLEQATMQFNEAERQIKRLGLQLQSERAKCNAEKKELESMLFDPQLTNESQLARLATLEQQLNAAKRDLESQRLRYEEQIRLLRGAAK